MSVHAASWAWRVSLAALENLPAEKRVAAHVARTVVAKLGDNANDDGEAWPSIATIGWETELGERTVQRALAALEEIGVIGRRLRPKRSTVYVLQMTGAAAAPLKEPRMSAVPTPITNARMGAAGDAPRVPLTTVKGAVAAPRTTKELPDELKTLPPDGGEVDSFAIELALTVEIGRSPITKTEKRDWRRAAGELAEVGASLDDVKARCGEYHRIWPSAALTPFALIRHWSMLGGSVELALPGSSLDVWIEKTAWQLPPESLLDILGSKNLDEAQVASIVARCAVLLAEHIAGDTATGEAMGGAAA